MAGVVDLITYPVKGCAGARCAAAQVTPAGLAHDRGFMVTGPDWVFRSQRSDPRLALIRPEIADDGARLMLRADGAEVVGVEVDTGGERRAVRLFRNPYTGIDQGDEVAGWLSEVLGAPSRLVRVPPEHDRITDGRTPGRAGYSDSGSVLLTTRSSLDDLTGRILARGGDPVPMDRFRPNIVLDGWPEPYREDLIDSLSVGGAGLAFAKVAIRCAVTLVDQATGHRAGPEPLRTLADYRRANAKGGVTFGVKLSVPAPGPVAVGDEVAVTAWQRAGLPAG